LSGTTKPRLSSAPSIKLPLSISSTLARYLDTGEGDVKRLRDIEPSEFRLRVGDYRLRFHDDGDTIRITAVKHRREAYR
jgi:mRNA-degrading endonuclease RelE of RelBE toxin-antitoxin system